MLANGDPMVHVQEITNDINLIGLRKPEPMRWQGVGGAQWRTSANMECVLGVQSPSDGCFSQVANPRAENCLLGWVSFSSAGGKVPVSASIIKQYRHR